MNAGMSDIRRDWKSVYSGAVPYHLAGTLHPTVDTWVVVHTHPSGRINRVYGPFDQWDEALAFISRLPGNQGRFATVEPVNGVG
jgi:hypothetical protein